MPEHLTGGPPFGYAEYHPMAWIQPIMSQTNGSPVEIRSWHGAIIPGPSGVRGIVVQNQPQQQIPARTEYPASIISGVSMECGAKASAKVIRGGSTISAATIWRTV